MTGIKKQTHTYNTNLGESLDEFFGADVREPLEFHVGQLLGEDRSRWAQLGDVHLKNTVDSSIRVRVWKKSGRHEIKCKWRATTFQRGVLRAMKGERGGPRIHSTEFTKTKSGNGRKPHTSPSFPFQFSSCRRLLLGQIQPSSYLHRGFQVVSGRPTPRRSQPPPPLDKDPLVVSWTAVVSKRLCQRFEGRGNDFEGCFDADRAMTKFISGCVALRWYLAVVYGWCINLSFVVMISGDGGVGRERTRGYCLSEESLRWILSGIIFRSWIVKCFTSPGWILFHRGFRVVCRGFTTLYTIMYFVLSFTTFIL